VGPLLLPHFALPRKYVPATNILGKGGTYCSSIRAGDATAVKLAPPNCQVGETYCASRSVEIAPPLKLLSEWRLSGCSLCKPLVGMRLRGKLACVAIGESLNVAGTTRGDSWSGSS
jgi:hypothetical protein